MARSKEGTKLTNDFYKSQKSIRATALKQLTKEWGKWDPKHPKSFDSFMDDVVDLVRAHYDDSSDEAVDYFDAFRKAEDPGGSGEAKAADKITKNDIKGNLRMTGFIQTMSHFHRGFSKESALKKGLVATSGSVGRMVNNGGRNTIIDAVHRDKKSGAWARVTADDPCYFCAMLASRGPVYTKDSVDFESHDYCKCGTEPQYEDSEWPGRGKEFESMWSEQTEGLKGKEAIKAFRKYMESK